MNGTSEQLPQDPLSFGTTESERLVSAVTEAIRKATHGRIQNVRVVIASDTCTVSGECLAYYHRQLAQQAIMSLLEGRKLIDEIRVG
ncbi:MAG: hypothetical protein WCV62_02980 [Candidatus Peribacteraceae bacterium]|jgi:hypothetical protein